MRYVLSTVGVLLSLSLAGSPLMLSAQGDATLYIVTYLEAAPASQSQVATMLTQLADASREEGAMRYEVLQRTTESNQFLLLEIWKDQRALDTHTGAAHTKRFREQVAPLLLGSIDERLCVGTIVAPRREGRGTVYIVTHIDVPGTSRDAAGNRGGFAAPLKAREVRTVPPRERTTQPDARLDRRVVDDVDGTFVIGRALSIP